MMIDVKFECKESFKTKEIKNFVEKSISRTLEMIKNDTVKIYVSVFLTNNKEIRKINSKFRNVDKETNVLSFPLNEQRMILNFENYLLLGDIVISLEKILSESKEQEKSFFNHLLHMIVHSILHLFGYDHKNQIDADKMEEKEKYLIKKLKKEIKF